MVMSRLLTGVFAVAAATAHAQPTAPPNGGGSAVKLRYESAFADYRPFTEIEILSWNRANSDAAMLRGHMGHVMRDAMPAQEQKSAPSTITPPRAALPAPTGHAGHVR